MGKHVQAVTRVREVVEMIGDQIRQRLQSLLRDAHTAYTVLILWFLCWPNPSMTAWLREELAWRGRLQKMKAR